MSTQNNQQSIVWVDIAKGIGIFLVVLGHVLRGLFSAGILEKQGAMLALENSIYAFHMPLFFFLSGLFVLKSSKNKKFKDFFSNKLDVIIYPYVIWSLLQGSIEVVMSGYTNGSPILWSEVFNLLIPRAQFWFLPALFLFLIAVALLKKIPEILFVLSAAMYFMAPREVSHVYVDYFSNFFVFFVFGVLWSKHLGVVFNLKNHLLFLGLFLVALAGINLYHVQFDDYGMVTFIVALMGIVATISLSQLLSGWPAGGLFKSLGIASLIIYLTHILAASGARVILDKFLDFDHSYIHVLLGTALGLLLPYTLYLMSLRFIQIRALFRFKELGRYVKSF